MITATNSHKPRIGVCSLLFNPVGQVLVGVRRNSYKAGQYGFPGGRVESGESLSKAIERELFEETGITNIAPKYVGAIRENQGSYDFIHFVYAATNVTAEPQLLEPDKCEGWQWQHPSEIKNLLTGHLAALELYKQRLY